MRALYGLTLVTNNTAEFGRAKGLVLEFPDSELHRS
jgi:hypothetical protein